MAGKRSKSSDRWLRRQQKDHFVRAAHAQGQVSRAHFKLVEIDQKYKLLAGNARILELGAAPGGWTNYLEGKLSNKGALIAVDPLPITAGVHTEVLVGLAGDEEVDKEIDRLAAELDGLTLVLSDMAPNISGIRAVDQARAMELADVARMAAAKWLVTGGHLAIKAFQGEGLDEWVAQTRQCFKKVVITKPKSSRTESREVFVVAKGFSGVRDAFNDLV
ncbi:MAG: 23S rRNA methyltransferase [Pseudomonadales bacterium]|nr:23S rRNA methyltransferase [Pseudomonadales bacterium]